VNTKTTSLLPLIVILTASTPAFGSAMNYHDPTVFYVTGFLLLCLAIVLLQFLVAYIDHFTARRSMEVLLADMQAESNIKAKQDELQRMGVGVSTSKSYSGKEESK
jgi:hypothetical protein